VALVLLGVAGVADHRPHSLFPSDEMQKRMHYNAKQTPLRVAFIGAGRMARLHVQALRRVSIPHEVCGVFDANTGAAEEFANETGATVAKDLQTLLLDPVPDVVHVCTTAGRHFEPAKLALEAGAHVYVEKPFVEQASEANELLAIAKDHGTLVCAGHQLIREGAFVQLAARRKELGALTLVDSYFAFRAPSLQLETASPRARAAQLLDIVPHPLYSLIAAMETETPPDATYDLEFVDATVDELHAFIRAGSVCGRLLVSLRARPIASTLSLSGTGGTLTADFVRATLIGAGNPGEAALEKVANPLVEGWQMGWRTVGSVARRVLSGGDYPGLAELLGDFYQSVAGGESSPVSPEHLARVTSVYEELARAVARAEAAEPETLAPPRPPDQPLAVVTGAKGFLGKEIARVMSEAGYTVRGVSRSADVQDPSIAEWVSADLSRPLPPEVFEGADIIVHAAAETAGGFEAHQHNSIDATRNVLDAAEKAGVRRLLYVSSISVLRPPRSPWEVQDEATPLVTDGRSLGAYTWGKTEAERLVSAAATAGTIDAKIFRLAALVDSRSLEFPGLLGRRLFGDWHLGLGRPGIPLAVCDVRTAAEVIEWSATCFDDAPPVVNLFDPSMMKRRDILNWFRQFGWHGRMVWVPISMMAGVVVTAKTLLALLRGERPTRLAAWAVLKPRRFDPALSQQVLQEKARASAMDNDTAEPVASEIGA
jgi:predicted dehydrogenase/nucleoside-diphosphate-sugar epimerase